MNEDPTIFDRLQTLLDDTTGKGFRLSMPRLVLDELEPFHINGFVSAFNDEFDTTLEPEDITEETTFRDLVHKLQDQ